MNRRRFLSHYTYEHLLWSVSVLAAFIAVFYLVPKLHDGAPGIALALAFEKDLPYVPALAIAYLMGYTIVLPPALFFPEIVFFRKGAAALLTAILVSGFFFAVFPVRCVPPLPIADLDRILAGLHGLGDNGYNAFPSLHVAIATICCLTLLKVSRLVSFYSLGVWMAIFASTILLKRHFLADSIAGLALGCACHFLIVEGEFKKRNIPWQF